MKLKINVSVTGKPGRPENHDISTFKDITGLGSNVARQVREWARQIPLTPRGSRLVVYLYASWQDQPGKTKKE